MPDDAHRLEDQTTFAAVTEGLVCGVGQRHLLLTLPDGQTTRFPIRGLSVFVAGVAD